MFYITQFTQFFLYTFKPEKKSNLRAPSTGSCTLFNRWSCSYKASGNSHAPQCILRKIQVDTNHSSWDNSTFFQLSKHHLYQHWLFAKHPSSVSVHHKSKLLLAHLLLFTVCQKMIPLFCCCSKSIPPEFSHCCRGCEDLLFSQIWSNRVCNKLEPAFMKEKKNNQNKPQTVYFSDVWALTQILF